LLSSLQSNLDRSSRIKKTLEEQKLNIEKARAEMTKLLETTAAESTNLFLVTRALALGAIGAIMSIFAEFVVIRHRNNLFNESSLARLWTTMAMGAIVAVVALGLFHTKQISIFSNMENSTGSPDFWRVTILCLLAGAFSVRLFHAAAGRVEQYLAASNRAQKMENAGSSRKSALRKKTNYNQKKSTQQKKPSKRQLPSLVEVGKANELSGGASEHR
jgi:glucan phosphoethanolaminetransferase (alkaline phosphatase superfamily)